MKLVSMEDIEYGGIGTHEFDTLDADTFNVSY